MPHAVVLESDRLWPLLFVLGSDKLKRFPELSDLKNVAVSLAEPINCWVWSVCLSTLAVAEFCSSVGDQSVKQMRHSAESGIRNYTRRTAQRRIYLQLVPSM